jgi:hypothetical protein
MGSTCLRPYQRELLQRTRTGEIGIRPNCVHLPLLIEAENQTWKNCWFYCFKNTCLSNDWENHFRIKKKEILRVVKPYFTVIKILGAAFAGALAAWLREVFVNYYRRAKLKVNGCDFHDNGTLREFYVIVRNFGKTTARACVEQLTIVPLKPFKVKSVGLDNEITIRAGSSASLSNISILVSCW